MKSRLVPCLLAASICFCTGLASENVADKRFEGLAARFVDEMPALSPVGATGLGDHRFDGELDQVSREARARESAFLRKYQSELSNIERAKLSRPNQVDYSLLKHSLASNLWNLEELQTWAWNPLDYTGLTGGSIYSLVAREFAPLPERLSHVTDRLEQFPRLLQQARATLEPARVPAIHAETAIKQNRGVLSIIESMVLPRIDVMPEAEKLRLTAAIMTATTAVEEHQKWLEEELLPNATGDFRIGRKLYYRKLAFSLHTSLAREDISQRAWEEYRRIRTEMYEIAKVIYKGEHPFTIFPDEADESYLQAIIRAGLEVAYRDLPARDEIVKMAKSQLKQATDFVAENNLVSLPGDPVEVILMPEFARGVSIAYCDSPGPLDTGQKTFYAISPVPEDWTTKQVHSFLREYNVYSMQDLTVHEAMPGHYLQLALSGRYRSTLRAVLQSGTFIEGWAVYAEQFMVEAGYNGDDPRQKLIALKWLMRSVTNAIMDQAIQCDGMSRDEAMKLMIEGGFQEEREAALKWVRAQLTSAQLSTYFIGYLEHIDLRSEIEKSWAKEFTLKRYHDLLLSFGSPPVKFVRSLMLDLPVPE